MLKDIVPRFDEGRKRRYYFASPAFISHAPLFPAAEWRALETNYAAMLGEIGNSQGRAKTSAPAHTWLRQGDMPCRMVITPQIKGHAIRTDRFPGDGHVAKDIEIDRLL